MVYIIPQNDKNELNHIITGLDKFKEKLDNTDYTHNQEEYFSIMRDFRKFLASFDDHQICELFVHSSKYQYYKSFFQSHNDYYLRTLETAEAIDIITNRPSNHGDFLKIIDKEYMRERYSKKASEFQSINFDNAKTFIVVGCGPWPDTILYIHENTNIEKIIGIDLNQEAIYIAGKLIHSLGLEKVQFVHYNGLKYDYKDADIIYIEGMVTPKNDILSRIAETSKLNVQILVDSPTHLLELLYEKIVPSKIHNNLKIIGTEKSVSHFYRQEMIKIEKFDI